MPWSGKENAWQKDFRLLREHEKREANEAKNKHSKLVLNGDGTGYRDQRLGSLRKAKSRAVLDSATFADWLDLLPSRASPRLRTIPTLRSIAISAAADDFGAPGRWADLPHELRLSIPLLFDAVSTRVREVPSHAGHLPFLFWAAICAKFPQDVPSRYRTYRGLVLDDTKELAALESANERGAEDCAEWREEQERERVAALQAGQTFHAAEVTMPAFFLTMLDLQGDGTFGDDDVVRIRAVARTLAVLRLDGTRVTDLGLGWISRAAGEDEAYQRLQVLTLRSTKVTNSAVSPLGRLPSLRMVDLRGTKCDTGSLRKALFLAAGRKGTFFRPAKSEVDYRAAHPRSNIRVLVRKKIELELFGPSLSNSRILTLLQLLADLEAGIPTEELRWSKPVAVHIGGTHRAPPDILEPAQGSIAGQFGLLAGSNKVLHNSSFGLVTGTSALSSETFHTSGMEYADKSAAFKSRNDSIAGGAYVGVGKTGGRASKFEEREFMRGFLPGMEGGLGPLSDSEDERESTALRKAREKEAEKKREADLDEEVARFYGEEPKVKTRPPRRVYVPKEDNLILLRHLPPRADQFTVPPMFDPVVVPADKFGKEEQVVGHKHLVEGMALPKKRQKVEEHPIRRDFFSPASATPHRSPPSTTRAPPSSLPPSSFASTFPSTQPPTQPQPSKGKATNRFASQGVFGASARSATAARVKPSTVARKNPAPAVHVDKMKQATLGLGKRRAEFNPFVNRAE